MTRENRSAVLMTEPESGRAGARDARELGTDGWREMAAVAGLGRARRYCGLALGRREYEPRKGVYNARHARSSCKDPACPRCGVALALIRWAVMVLAMARHVRSGGFMVLVSVAPRHRRSESAETKLARIRLVTDWLPGRSGGPGRAWMRDNRVESWVRIIEPTLGGQHGVNFGAHFLLFCRPVEGERPEVTALELADRLRRGMDNWAAELILAGGDQAEALADEWGHYLADVAWDSRLAGVSQAARYLTKLADGPGVGAAASEVTDPTGTKVGRRNVSLRGLPMLIAAETVRMGYRRTRAAIRRSEWLRELIEQFADVQRARLGPGRSAAGKSWRSTQFYRASDRLFQPWDSWPFDKLMAAALEVIAAEDPAGAVEVAGLVELIEDDPQAPEDPDPDDDPDPAPVDPEPVSYDGASQAFHRGEAEAGSVDHDDDAFFQVVALDEDIGHAWASHEAGGDQAWGVDTAVCRLLDQRGAWGGVVALRDAVRSSTGERLFLYCQGQPRVRGPDGKLTGSRPRLLVTADPDAPGWVPLDWEDAERAAAVAPRRRRLSRMELAQARRGTPTRAAA